MEHTHSVVRGEWSTSIALVPCTYCNGHHAGTCPRIKAIEYHPNGAIKRIEFKDGTSR